jgi:hypothetical protein
VRDEKWQLRKSGTFDYQCRKIALQKPLYLYPDVRTCVSFVTRGAAEYVLRKKSSNRTPGLTKDALALIAAHRITAFLESIVPAVSLLRIPERMRRPSAACEALRFSPLMEARRTHSPSVECVPRMTALAEPLVFFPGRPAAQRAADAGRFRWFPVAVNLTVRRNAGSISRWTHLCGSLNSLFFGKAAPIFSRSPVLPCRVSRRT